ncbi:GNAT family N-acetyltransferase [Mycobacterium deserti]|uniref:Lysine N-acyltransferase MbtK n=1 Tax=Mycobacterium deserti TaxID=2978347 RepID=A0ABT2M9T9_9MYCO|nr:GNAT family N-acetyltransferase [Mycobacterium deserti]MCT7659032.1 acetyltransferase [Mycobacterium deserti]
MGEIDEAAAGVLPRELTDLPQAVRDVPAPPTPILPAPYSIRLADADADAQLISGWMNSPHLIEAWQYAWSTPRWRRYLGAQLSGEYSRPLIGESDGTPFVYVELYRAAKDSIARCYDADPYDVGLHAAIGDERFIHRGIAPILLPRLIDSIFTVESRCRRIMFDPDHRNADARAICEVVGSMFLGEHDMANRRMALYALPRDPAS